MTNEACGIGTVGGDLDCLVNSLREKGIKIDAPAKWSHEDKPLRKHVEECWEFARKLIDMLKLSEKVKKLCYSLCVTHDLGKLDPEWEISKVMQKKLRIPHSARSFEFAKSLEENLLTVLLPKNYHPIMLFSVLTHHTSLDVMKIANSPEWRKVRSFLKNGNKEIIIDASDAIGIFKLADMISAAGLHQEFSDLVLQQYEWSKDFERRIGRGIVNKAKSVRGLFDKEKFMVQSEVAGTKQKHLAVIAPTGWGKTALAILRTSKIKPKKIFYCLPTITAIKDFSDSLKKMFGIESVGEYFYFADVEHFKQEETSEVTYPINFHRYFVPKITITTVDQMLMTAIQVGKYHMRRFNFRDALMIFDEFHLLTPQMVGILKAFLEQLADVYNLSILLMSATPSELYLKEFEECLENKGGFSCKRLHQEYKSLKRHKIKHHSEGILDFIQENPSIFRGKGRILV
ncbi:MAG: DEAD/DEAH box helicase, partial [Candidatus Jordarchaeaceae archaeon]